MAEGPVSAVGAIALCFGCGSVRLEAVECRLCEVLARNIALEEEVKDVRSVLQDAKEELLRLRGDSSVRSKSGVDVSARESEGDGWRVVGRGRKEGARRAPRGGRDSPSQWKVECSNRFDLLPRMQEEEEVVEIEVGSIDETTPSSGVAPSASEGKIVVVGDSQLKGLGGAFCAKDARRRTCVVFSGAGVDHVEDRLESVLAREGAAPTVCLSVGGNDLGWVRDEEIFRKYRIALGKVRDLGGVPVVCGVLPRKYAGHEWLAKASALNSRLADLCRRSGWLFIDNWNCFFGKDHLYARDGVHLSKRGTEVLAWTLQRDLGRWGFLESV